MKRLAIAMVVVAWGGAAQAFEHNAKMNEVLIAGTAGAQYLEVFDFAEPFTAPPYNVVVYDAGGTVMGQSPVAASVLISTSAAGKPTLISNAAADAQFTVTGDAALTVTLPAVGQACLVDGNGNKIHCIAWGCIASPLAGFFPAGTGAAPAANMSLSRQVDGTYAIVLPTPKRTNEIGGPSVACPPDAGVPPIDSGTAIDASTIDGATPIDGSLPADASSTVDSGSSTVDARVIDASTQGSDAAARDAAQSSDSGSKTGGSSSGCGCRSAGAPTGSAPIAAVLVGLGLVWRRRRR